MSHSVTITYDWTVVGGPVLTSEQQSGVQDHEVVQVQHEHLTTYSSSRERVTTLAERAGCMLVAVCLSVLRIVYV